MQHTDSFNNDDKYVPGLCIYYNVFFLSKFFEQLTIKQHQTGPFGGTPDQGISIIGDDKPLAITAMDDFPPAQDIKEEE